MNLLFWIFAFIGHLGFWCVIYNLTHATSWPRKTRKFCEKLVILAVLVPFFWTVVRMVGSGTVSFLSITSIGIAERCYLVFSLAMGGIFFFQWAWRKLQAPPASLLSKKQRRFDVQKLLGRNIYLTPLAKTLKKIPFNQAHCIAVDEIELQLERLPKRLDGLRICHLSDFHLTGQIDLAYFEKVVEESNRFDPDLIAVTGDLVDEDGCLDWIEPVFGQLKAKHGVFFIRGNHDLRIPDQEALLQRLQASGMDWLGGGSWKSIEIDGTSIQFTGNELPWHSGAEGLQQTTDSNAFRILLSHSPDQINWARKYDFDLILAGHNHGGQIVIPVVGPIVAPSKYGVRYAAGTYEAGSAVMRVSRGLSGDECIRIGCPPEVGCITLRSKA